MAESSSVIELIFKGVDQTTDTIKTVSGSLDTLGSSATALAKPFANLAELFELTGTAAAITAGIIGTIAVKAAADFTSALTDLDRFLKTGEGSARDYRDTFQSLAVQYGVSANEIVKSTADWSAANFKIKDSLNLTTLALDYATAGQLSAGEATSLLKQLLSGLNVEQDKSISTLNRWGDIVNFVSDESKSDFKELAIAISGLAPSFSTSGASAEQFVAIINSSVELFQSGSKAADGLRTIIGQISTPTDAATAALAEFGIKVNDAGVVQGTFYEAMSRIAAKWPTLTDEQKRNTAATIVSAERADQFKNILDTWPQSMEIARKAVVDSTGSIAKEVDRALKTTNQAFLNFQQALNNLFVSIGEQLEPVTVDVTKSLQNLAQAFQKLVDSGALKPLFDVLNKQGSELAELFNAIAENLPAAFAKVDLSPLATAFEDLGKAFSELFGKLFGELDLTTIEGLAKALQLVVNGGAAFIRTLEGIITSLGPLAETINGAVTGFNKLDSASQVNFGEFIGTMQVIVTTGPKVAAALLLAAEAGIDFAKSATGAFGAIKVAINALQISFDIVAIGTLVIVKSLTEAKLAFLEFTGGDWIERNRLKGVLEDIQKQIDSFAASADKNGKEFKDGWQLATEGTSAELDKLGENLKKSRENIENFGKSAKDSGAVLADWQGDVADAAEGVTDAFSEIDDYKLNLPELDTGKWTIAADDLDLSEPLGKSADAMTAFEKAADDAAFGTGKFGEAAKSAATGTKEANLKTAEWSKSLTTLQFSKADELSKDIKITGDAFSDAGTKTGIYSTALEGVSTKYEQVGTGTVKATGAFKAVGDSASESSKKVEEATKKSDEFLIKMEEIASNERIKTIEAVVSLNIAALEADVKRVESLFASIDNTVSSTGDLLGSLFGNLIDTTDRFKELEIQEQIDLENKRRQEALDIQKKLAEAEIERIQAQTRALERGDSIIKIDGTGLAPQLEAFMWEILKAIRVRVNAEFSDYLLGIT